MSNSHFLRIPFAFALAGKTYEISLRVVFNTTESGQVDIQEISTYDLSNPLQELFPAEFLVENKFYLNELLQSISDLQRQWDVNEIWWQM